MKAKLIGLILLAGSSLFARSHWSVNVGIGVPAYGYGYYAPPPAVVYAPPPVPGPGYTWISGYWYPVGPRMVWRDGYWARRPFRGAYWVAPRHHGHRYYPGYWRRWR